MATTTPRYPDVEVQLLGQDGNAMVIIGAVRTALKKHLRKTDPDATVQERDAVVAEFTTEAMSGDYDHLLQTCMAWVEVT